jgi:hypothetical protein
VIHLHCSSRRSFGEGLIEEVVGDLREPWMRQADHVLEDEKLLSSIDEALLQRHPKSRTRSTKSAKRKQHQKQRWFKKGQNWRNGCEGRISLLKRRHGLNRSRYKNEAGMKRCVGLGVIADDLINIGRGFWRKRKK